MFWKKIGNAACTFADSIGGLIKEKVFQSKEDHVLSMMTEMKDENIKFSEYAEVYNDINKLREGKDLNQPNPPSA